MHGTIGALRRNPKKSIWPLLSWKQSNRRLEHSQYLQAGCTYMLHMLWSSIIHQIISIFRPSVCQFSGMQKVPASQNVYSTTSYVITNFWYQKSKQVNFYQLWDHWTHMKLEIVGEKSPRPRVCQLHLHAVWLWVRKYLGRTQKIDNGTISPLSTPLQAVTMVPAVLNRIGAWTQ